MRPAQKLLLILIIAANAVVLYLWYKNNREGAPTAPGKAPDQPGSKTVRDDMKASGQAYITGITDAEIKKYAGWLDRAIALAKTYAPIQGSYSPAVIGKGSNKEMDYNLSEILKLTDENFKKVIQYWKNVRSGLALTATDLKKAQVNITTVPIDQFFTRLKKLNIS